MNLADLPWRPMGSLPKGGYVIVIEYFNAGRTHPLIPAFVHMRHPWGANGAADGWLTLAEFNKLVNGENAGI